MTEEEFISAMEQKQVPKKDRSAALYEFRRRQSYAATQARMSESVAAHPILGLIANAVGGVATGVGDTLSFGYAPRAAGAIRNIANLPGNLLRGNVNAAPDEGADVRGMMDARREANPISNTVGRVGGYFVPGPAKALTSLAARGGTAAMNVATRGVVAKAAAESPFIVRSLANFATNVAGAIPAAATVRLVENRDEDYDIVSRARQAMSDVASPTSLALITAGSLVQAKLTVPRSVRLKQVIDKFERRTGQKVPVDTLTDDAVFQATFDRIAKMPGMEREAAKVQRMMIEGVLDYIDDIGQRTGVGSGARAPADAAAAAGGKAASGVRRVAGVFETSTKGAIDTARTGAQRSAFDAEGADRISDAGVLSIRNGLAQILRGRSKAGELGAFGEVVRKTHRLTDVIRERAADGSIRIRRRPNMTLQDMEEIRQQTASAAAFVGDRFNTAASLSKQGNTLARDYYHVLEQVVRAESPLIANAVRDGEKLRRFADAMPPQRFVNLNETTGAQFWAKEGVLNRIELMKQYGSPDEFSALKGWLFWDLVTKTVDPRTGRIATKRLEAAFRSSRHNRQLWDRVMPGAREELLELSTLTDTMFGRGLLGPLGSQTYSRSSGMTPTKLAAAAAALVAALYTNPSTAIPTTIGASGLLYVAHRASQSLISGAGQSALQNLARGGAPPAIPQLAPAAGAVMNPARGAKP